MALFCGGCLVTEGTYVKKVQEADNLTKELAALHGKYKDLAQENNALKEQIRKLNGDLTAMTGEKDRISDSGMNWITFKIQK